MATEPPPPVDTRAEGVEVDGAEIALDEVDADRSTSALSPTTKKTQKKLRKADTEGKQVL